MTTYYELIFFLDSMLKAPLTEDNIEKLNNANVSLTKDRYIRFINQVTNFMTQRLRNTMNKVIDTVCERYLDVNELTLELNNIRSEITYMQKLVNTKLIKEENRQMFYKSLVSNNNEIFNEIKSLYTEDEFILLLDGYIIKEN